MKVTLHCNVPYDPDMPNAAIGYLKGFLKEKGVETRNIYWNLILREDVRFFTSKFRNSFPDMESIFEEYTSVYMLSKLLKPRTYERTLLDSYLKNIFPEHIISSRLEALVKKIEAYITSEKLLNCDVAGFTMKTYQWISNYIIIKMMKKINPDLKVLIGGLGSPTQAKEFLKVLKDVDYVIWGEGEYPMLDFLSFLDGEKREDEVPNFVYRHEDRLKSTYEIDTSVLPPLDSYPFADHYDYFKTLSDMKLEGIALVAPIWGSRSCHWNRCKFCNFNKGYSFRERSPENILREIAHQSEKHKIDRFMFTDSDVTGSNKGRLKKLLELIYESSSQRKKLYNLWGAFSPIFIDRENSRLLKLAGFDAVDIGYEAMTDTLLSKMRKRHSFAHNIQILKLGEEFGLNIGGLNVIRGIPNEEASDVIESVYNLRFIRFFLSKYDIKPHNSLTLFKDSPFYEDVSAENRSKWNINPIHNGIEVTGLLKDADKFEFFGFKSGLANSYLWEKFEYLLSKLKECRFSYSWIDYGSFSVIEERGFNRLKYTPDRDKTDILLFCDTIRHFVQVKERFSHIDEIKLIGIIKALKEATLLYYDEDLSHIISCVSAKKMVKMK